MAQKNKVKELVGRGLNSYHTKSLQQIDRIEKKNKEQNHKISILSNELDNDYLTKTEEGSVISLEHSKEGMVYLDELQGNTLVNYCTDGSKEMTLNGDIDVEGTFVTTTEGVDNGKIDVMCEGNTLVNLSETKEKLNQTNTHYGDVYLCEIEKIKPNTTYTLSYDFECNINFPIERCYLGYAYGKSSMRVESSIKFNPVIGKNKLVFTIPSTEWENAKNNGDIYFLVRVFIDNNKLEKTYSSKNVLLLEGDWSNKEIPPYFEGMKSVGQDDVNGHKIEILSQNKNLFKDKLTNLEIASGQNDYSSDHAGGAQFIRIKPNTPYTLSSPIPLYNSLAGLVIAYYDINKKFIKHINMTENKISPSNARYCRVRTRKNPQSSISTEELSSILLQLEEGTVATSHVQGSMNKKEILLNEPLRRVPNEVKDKIVKIGNKWFVNRNCDEVVVNGVKGSFTIARETDDYILFYIQGIVDNSIALGEGGKGTTSICDIFGWSSYGSDGLEYHTVSPYSAKLVAFNIKKSRLNEVTVDGIKKWLQSNPVKVVYQLKTPIYEPLEVEPTLNTYNDVTHISNNSIIPCNMKIQNSGYSAIIKPSTLYTVALDTNKSGTIGMNLGGAKGTTTNNVLKLTTPATLADDSLRLYGKGIKGSKVRLLEGDKTNWIPSHFEGMKSSFEDKLQDDGTYKMEILSNNQNLVKELKAYSGNNAHSYVVEGNTVTLTSLKEHQGYFYTGFNFGGKLKPNTTYYISSNIIKSNPNTQPCIRMYDTKKAKDYAFLKQTGSVRFTTPSTEVDNIKMLLYSSMDNVSINNGDTIIYENIQISEVDANYVEPKFNKIQFSSIEPLRKWDRFVFKDGKLMIERGSGKAIFNGSEGWNGFGVSDKKSQAYYFNLDKAYGYNNVLANNKSTNQTTYVQNKDEISGTPNNTAIWVSMDKRFDTIEKFKQELKENNLVVIYQKTEPTYEEIPYELQKIILEGYENGTLFFDTNIPPTSTVTYAGETPIVKATKLNKTEVLNNTNDINDNIIPYLMDMDYRVVCLQLETNVEGISMARLFGGAYEMLKRDIQSNRLSKEEYGYRLIDYFNAGKLTEEEVRELEDLK